MPDFELPLGHTLRQDHVFYAIICSMVGIEWLMSQCDTKKNRALYYKIKLVM